MGDKTGIGWTDATWNPVRGCSRASRGCTGCYAELVAARFSGPGQAYEGFADRNRAGSSWTGKVELIPHMLDQPLRWQRPRRVFVNSMSDLFHENLPFSEIDRVFDIMEQAERHIFQVLTKRSARMRDYTSWRWSTRSAPPAHIHLGVSIEDQDAARARMSDLKRTIAAVRFVSAEPLIGRVDLCEDLGIWWNTRTDTWVRERTGNPAVDWLICGGESGPKARPMRREWAETLRWQCEGAGVAFFMKQVGSNRPDPQSIYDLGWPNITAKKGDDPSEWPPSLQLQQFPGECSTASPS